MTCPSCQTTINEHDIHQRYRLHDFPKTFHTPCLFCLNPITIYLTPTGTFTTRRPATMPQRVYLPPKDQRGRNAYKQQHDPK